MIRRHTRVATRNLGCEFLFDAATRITIEQFGVGFDEATSLPDAGCFDD
jgi:hypothetical protein